MSSSALPCNSGIASKRLYSTEKRLLKNSKFATACTNVIDFYIKKEYVKKIEKKDDEAIQQCPLPHFPVLRPEKSTAALRIVFDASAQCDGISLNDAIAVGPKLQQDLVSVLLRFRKRTVCIVCDVAEMYLRIPLSEKDRPFVRFLWRDLNQSCPSHVYEFSRVVFDLNFSPFIAQYVTQQHAKQFSEKFPRAAETVLKSTYMDDSMDSVDAEKEGIGLYGEVIKLCGLANMHARKWILNSLAVTQHIPINERASCMSFNGGEILPRVKTLGLWWTATENVFEYKFVAGEMVTVTKRQWLSKIFAIFDPMGFVASFIVQARILTQRMWVKGYEWDKKIEGDIETACRNWLNEICCMSKIKISRWLGFNQDVVVSEFHVFVDASSDTYGAVCYVRHVYVDKSVKVCFVLSRGRVAPLKCMTAPKLELMAAVVGLKVGKIVPAAMNCSLKCFYFWSDIMNVLWWIRGYSRSFKPFVAHRVGQIQ